MKTIKWAVIGVGRFGKIHARVLSSLPGSELIALSNRNQIRLTEAATEFNIQTTATDYRDILDDPDIDAVSITTHWQDHHEVALAALQSGKHVLLEKPMAANSAQCLELIQAAKEAAGFFMVGHVCRFDPRVTLAKEAIDAGRIGRIVSMHARRNLPKAPGSIRLDKISPLLGDGIHDADLMMWFLNRAPSQVYGRNISVENFQYPDLGWAMLHFDDDAIGVVETVWCLPENSPTVIDAKMEIIGTEGKLSIDATNTGLSILDSSGEKNPDTVYWPMQYGRQIGALERELAYFSNCIRTGTAPTVITPHEAARALAVMETAELSSQKKQPLSFDFPAL
ncbi:MAG: Gfo/Idh/MocA family oxidoreductase [Verrucomicrobiales bacterium]|nr:Gfo/Idh/MocA family oxidoreductase [Verrucomicrobiales bacterium]